jgi:heterodisulfide reductase subunit C
MSDISALSTEPSFLDEVIDATSGGDRLRSCLQCGTCGGSCPNGSDMDHTPRALFALIAAGEREEVLSADAPWFCVSCYACTVRCPRKIPITDLMYTLKRIAAREHFAKKQDAVALAENFNRFILRYGRSFEFGIASRFYLTRKLGSIFSLGPLGIRMMRHGRLSLTPSKIENLAQLHAILDKARELGGES